MMLSADSCPGYVEDAFTTFDEIMAGARNNMMDVMNRANKGELFVLHFLSMSDGALLPSELSKALQVTTARISALLGSLEKKGQVERELDKNNRVNILVTITESGRERVNTELRNIKSYLTGIFTDMGEADTVEFIRLIKRFFDLSYKYCPDYLRRQAG